MKERKLFPRNPVAEHDFLPNWLAEMRLFPFQLQNLLLESKFHCNEKFRNLGLSNQLMLSLKTEGNNSLEVWDSSKKFPPGKLLWLIQSKNRFMFV